MTDQTQAVQAPMQSGELDLSFVITWLEGGCDPKEAAKELRLLQAKLASPSIAAPEQALCRDDGRCQYAIDHGAEGLGHCPAGKCCMPPPAPPVVARELTDGESLTAFAAMCDHMDAFVIQRGLDDERPEHQKIMAGESMRFLLAHLRATPAQEGA